MAQFNVPQFNESMFGGDVYSRTLTASPAIGLSATITRAMTYNRTLTATSIGLFGWILYKAQNPRHITPGTGTDREVIPQRRVTTGTF